MIRKPIKGYIARGDLPSPLLCMTTTGGGWGVGQWTRWEGCRPRGSLLTQRLKVRDRNIGQTSPAITYSPVSLSLPQLQTL